jgi:prepilin-type processing-associated H-X9-DG protein
MKKQAFTLVELLIIVAIIAVLAAVLFPVFATAQSSAGQLATLDHLNVIANGEAIYAQDYDNYFVLMSQDSANMECPNQFCFGGYPYPSLNWPILLLPYVGGNINTYVNPATGDPQGYFGKDKNSNIQNWNDLAQYGYNYQFLSPITFNYNFNSNTETFPCLGRSYGGAIHPSTTVMFVTAQGWPTPTSGSAQFNTPDFDFAQPPGTAYEIYEAPDRLDWVGNGSSAPGWINNWMKSSPVGEITADVRCLQPKSQATVAWVDGHVSNMTADQLAAGTNFETATTTENYGFGTDVTDLSKYLWTLDGTLTDVE